MTKNAMEITGRIALFRDGESEPGEPSTTGGVSVDLDAGSGIISSALVEHDADTVHGSELPTRIYSPHREAAGSLSQKRAKPDFLAFALAYFFGECSSSLVGASAYKHEITAAQNPCLPSFTAVQRRGAQVFKERLSGNYIEAFTLDIGEGWVSLSAEVIGTGHREVNYEHETVSAPANSLSITLAANGVQGADGEERLANVYRVRARDVGSQEWTVLQVVSVSGDVPAVIQFSQAVGSSTGNIDFHVDYLPVEPAWCTLPDPVDESPLRLVDARVVVDGYFDGSALKGGEELAGELTAFSVSGKNGLELSHFPGASGPAAAARRGKRELSIALTESLRDTVRQYQTDHPDTEHLSLALVIKGAEIDPGGGVRFGADLIFPRCGILKAPVTVQGGRLAQAGDLVVMDDGVYGGIVVRCYNRQTGYL